MQYTSMSSFCHTYLTEYINKWGRIDKPPM